MAKKRDDVAGWKMVLSLLDQAEQIAKGIENAEVDEVRQSIHRDRAKAEKHLAKAKARKSKK